MFFYALIIHTLKNNAIECLNFFDQNQSDFGEFAKVADCLKVLYFYNKILKNFMGFLNLKDVYVFGGLHDSYVI